MDTYTLNFAKNDIDKVKSIIRLLFSNGFSYSLKTIKQKVNNMLNIGRKIDDLYILYALDEFVKNQLELVDYYDRTGYLIYIPVSANESYYVFQPNSLNDTSIPIQLRDTPLSIKEDSVTIDIEKTTETGKKTKSIKTSKLDFSLYDKLIEKYSDTESPETAIRVIQHILEREDRKDDLNTTIIHQFLDKLEYRQLIELFNIYIKKELTDKIFNDSLVDFFKNLCIMEMYNDIQVLMIPDIKMKKMWFYKFNNKTKSLKKIIGGSSEITEIQEYLMEKGLIKKDKIVLTNVDDYGFKYKFKKDKDSEEKKESEVKKENGETYGFLGYHSRTNKIDFRFFDKKNTKKETKAGRINLRNVSRGKVCGPGTKKREFSGMIKSIMGKDIIKKGKKKYNYNGKIIKDVDGITKENFCEIIKFLMYYSRIRYNRESGYNKLNFIYRYENVEYTIPQLKSEY